MWIIFNVFYSNCLAGMLWHLWSDGLGEFDSFSSDSVVLLPSTVVWHNRLWKCFQWGIVLKKYNYYEIERKIKSLRRDVMKKWLNLWTLIYRRLAAFRFGCASFQWLVFWWPRTQWLIWTRTAVNTRNWFKNVTTDIPNLL